jgi:hypothetical protein
VRLPREPAAGGLRHERHQYRARSDHCLGGAGPGSPPVPDAHGLRGGHEAARAVPDPVPGAGAGQGHLVRVRGGGGTTRPCRPWPTRTWP